MKATIKLGILLLAFASATGHAEEKTCAAGHEQELGLQLLLRVGVLAERTKKNKHVDYDLRNLRDNTHFEILGTGIVDPRGNIEVKMKAGYTTAKGSQMIFAFTNAVDTNPRMEYAQDTIMLNATNVGEKHDKEGNITNPGHCDVTVGWFGGSPTVLSLFNAKTGVWVNSVDLASERMRLY
jgi:hypothetical protein